MRIALGLGLGFPDRACPYSRQQANLVIGGTGLVCDKGSWARREVEAHLRLITARVDARSSSVAVNAVFVAIDCLIYLAVAQPAHEVIPWRRGSVDGCGPRSSSSKRRQVFTTNQLHDSSQGRGLAGTDAFPRGGSALIGRQAVERVCYLHCTVPSSTLAARPGERLV
jgi:hypothetical protein